MKVVDELVLVVVRLPPPIMPLPLVVVMVLELELVLEVKVVLDPGGFGPSSSPASGRRIVLLYKLTSTS